MSLRESKFSSDDKERIDKLAQNSLPLKAIKSILDLFEKGDVIKARKRISLSEEFLKRQNKERYAAEKIVKLAKLVNELKTIESINNNGMNNEKKEFLKNKISFELKEVKNLKMYHTLGMAHMGEFTKTCGLNSEEVENLMS